MATHALGNGAFLVYGRRASLTEIVGPPYTAPSFASLTVADEADWTSRRVPRTNTWEHVRADARLVDCLDPALCLFARKFAADAPVTLAVTPGAGVAAHVFRDYDFGAARADCLALRLPMGTNFFTSLATDRERWLLIAGRGVTLATDAVVLEGTGEMYLAAGTLPDAAAAMGRALAEPSEAVFARSEADFAAFFARVRCLGAGLPPEVPDDLAARASAAGESAAALIRAQQSREGGVQAGNCYPLAYVRDNAGTMRGMLALGMHTEARRVLRFFFERFRLHGDVRNAEGMGNLSARLRFPNDEAEVPAYLIAAAFRCADETGDPDLVRELWPMLRWAFEVQLPQLAHGMTPFSGDETYIAGGTLPRIHTYDGSAESTLLFVMGGGRLLDFAARERLLTPETVAAYHVPIDEAKSRYRENFVRDGRLLCNNPDRLAYRPKPAYCEGFCEAHDILRHDLRLGWNRYDPANGYFCCPDCFGKPLPPQADVGTRYLLSSASLLPAFYDCAIFSRDELDGFLAPYAALFEANGFVPSNSEGTRSLGYDYGLFLKAAAASVRYRHLALPALAAALDVLDEAGAWVEYYDGGVPAGCPCRPWESGLNVTAIAEYREASF